jgi:hypothetical protein
MEEPVKVYIRVRPPNETELLSKDYKKCTEVPSAQTLNLIYPRDTLRPFHFDGVLNENSTETETYELSAKKLVDHVLQGYNGTFFVYGQTGTGKTHTMGLLKKISPKSEGIIPLALRQIYNQEKNLSITLSFLQIYMENVYDLLKPDKKPLKLREDPSGGAFVSDLTQVPTDNFNQAVNLINAGICNRIMGSHNANQTSSRSHIVLALDIEQGGRSSRLTLIDLAGSERVGSTSSSGLRLDEAKFINSSLSALGKVISALSTENLTHIPFRDSKLTRLLQPSLNGKVVLVATVSPCYKYGGETISTLQFASRCKQVICIPTLEEDLNLQPVDLKTIQDLRRREEFLTARVKELETQNSMIFNHSHSEVIYYLLRLLAKVTQNSIKLTQEVDKVRNEIDLQMLKAAEEKFPYPLSGYRKENDEEYMKELFVKLDTLPSAQVVEKVQFMAKKLVDNMNILGKLAVQAQYLKGTFSVNYMNESYFDTLKREASEVLLHPKQKALPLAPARPQFFKITDNPKEKQEKLQKNLSLKELLQSKKNNASFEILESRIATESDIVEESAFTSRDLPKQDSPKRIQSRSPLPVRRATFTRRPNSKDSQPEVKEKSEVLTRVATKVKLVKPEAKQVSPFKIKINKSVLLDERERKEHSKDDFLAELEKELVSISADDWLEGMQ